MGNFFEKLRQQIKEFWEKLERRDKIRLTSLAVLIIIFSIVIAVVLGRTTYTTLYYNLPATEAGNILTALDEMGIQYKTEGTGTIMVPADQASEVEMRLSSQGFNTGALDLSIWNSSSGITTTESERQMLSTYQAMENIRTAIMAIDKIENCIVLLNPIKESSYLVNPVQTDASASVMLTIKGGEKLTPSEAQSIAAIVTGAVAGLEKENVRIIDSNLNLYNLDDYSGTDALTDQIALTEQVRNSLQQQITNLLSPVFGEQNVRPSVHVTLNFDREVINSVEFEPPVEGSDGGIPVSLHEAYEQVLDGIVGGGVPGSDTNGLNVIEYPYGDLTADEYYRNYVREVNYEINETRRQIEVAQGTIKSLSIAVLLDSETITEDYTSNVRNLVSNALGINSTLISVERLPFNFANSEVADAFGRYESMMNALKNREIIKTAIVALAAVLLVFLIVMLVRGILNSKQAARDAELAMAMAAAGATVDYLAGDDEDMMEEMEEGGLPEIDLNAKPESITQIEKFIDRDPAAVASLLRNWISDEY